MTSAPLQSRKAAKFLFGFFIVLAITTFTWGFFVVEKVRARAKEVDGALRLVAWECLCCAQQKSQQQANSLWPESVEALIASANATDCDTIESPDASWPATKDAALAGLTVPASLALACGLVAADVSTDPRACPHLSAMGNPSGLDTLEVVNGWLIAYAKAQYMKSNSVPK